MVRAAAFEDFTVSVLSVAEVQLGGDDLTVLQVCLPESVHIGFPLKLKIKINASRLTGRELEI